MPKREKRQRLEPKPSQSFSSRSSALFASAQPLQDETRAHSSKALTRAAQMKSLRDSPPTAWVL